MGFCNFHEKEIWTSDSGREGGASATWGGLGRKGKLEDDSDKSLT